MMLDDDLLERAAKEARGRMLAETDDLPEHEFSELFEVKMQRLLDGEKPARLRRTSPWMRRAAAFVLVGFVGLSACVLSVDAWRVRLFEMVEEKHPEYSGITYEPVSGTSSDALSGLVLAEYRPSYIPEGFLLTEQLLDEAVNWSTYSNRENQNFSFHQTILGIGSSAINTEGSELTKFEMNGEPAYKMSNRGAQFVLWSDEQYEFMITADWDIISLDEAVRIAQSVTVCPQGAYHPPELKVENSSLPDDYTVEQARENGDMVMTSAGLEHPEQLERLVKNAENEVADVVRIADFTAENGKTIAKRISFDGFLYHYEEDYLAEHSTFGYQGDLAVTKGEDGWTVYELVWEKGRQEICRFQA